MSLKSICILLLELPVACGSLFTYLEFQLMLSSKFLKLLVMGGFKGDSGNENMNQVGSLQLVLSLLACIFLMIGNYSKHPSLLDKLVCLASVIKIQDVLSCFMLSHL